MNIIHAVFLGIIEGITEFLPISSTAHLEITSRFLGLLQSDFLKSFEISIQLGAILAVVVIYAKKIIHYRRLWKPVIVAFIPTAVVGFVLYKIIKSYLLGNDWLIVATLFVGGLVLLWFEYRSKEGNTPVRAGHDAMSEIASMKISTAITIGFAQSLAVIPGVSRSAATIIAGSLFGMSRMAIVEFSFLLAIPTMAAATGYDILKNGSSFDGGQLGLLAVGFVAAFISALASVRLLLKYVQNHTFVSFGIYRVVVALVFAVFLVLA